MAGIVSGILESSTTIMVSKRTRIELGILKEAWGMDNVAQVVEKVLDQYKNEILRIVYKD